MDILRSTPLRDPVKSSPLINNKALKDKKILVVEDNEDLQLLFTATLSHAGALSVLAKNGLESLVMARMQSFDAILMDIQMPLMDGHQAMKQLRNDGCTVPIIALTAHALNEEREAFIAQGFDDLIPKSKGCFHIISQLQGILRKQQRIRAKELCNVIASS